MKSHKISSLVLSLALVAGCSSAPKVSETQHLTAATTWFQTAGENFALQYQAYRLARLALDENLRQKKGKGLPPAVVVDVDETVLSNGPAQANMVLTGKGYPAGWTEWMQKASAKAIRGSVDFLKYADSKKVKVFYVTNRRQEHQGVTMKNLAAVGFPNVTEASVLCSHGEWNKDSRRNEIRKSHDIVLLVGDNLNDFSSEFPGKSVTVRNDVVDAQKDRFGTTYILIPNPMYGDWEEAIYKGNFALPPEEKEKAIRSALEASR